VTYRSAGLIDTKVAAYEQHLAAGATGDPWQTATPNEVAL
jgi:hypothetical protein